MTISVFRANLETAFRQSRLLSDKERTQAVATVLQSHGLIRKADGGWAESLLSPAIEAVWERSLETPDLAAVLACEWFETSLDLNLVSRGLLLGDEQVLYRLSNPSDPIRPSFPSAC